MSCANGPASVLYGSEFLTFYSSSPLILPGAVENGVQFLPLQCSLTWQEFHPNHFAMYYPFVTSALILLHGQHPLKWFEM